MKAITEKFTNEEFEKLKNLKTALDLSWHDFILVLAQKYEEAEQESD
jgi:hypothetical protein